MRPTPADRETLLRVLELTATQAAPTAAWLVAALLRSQVGAVVSQLAQDWGVTVADLTRIAVQGSADLQLLEAHRLTWAEPAEVIKGSHAGALADLATARTARVLGGRRVKKLERIAELCSASHQAEMRARQVVSFLRQSPESPVAGSHRASGE